MPSLTTLPTRTTTPRALRAAAGTTRKPSIGLRFLTFLRDRHEVGTWIDMSAEIDAFVASGVHGSTSDTPAATIAAGIYAAAKRGKLPVDVQLVTAEEAARHGSDRKPLLAFRTDHEVAALLAQRATEPTATGAEAREILTSDE